MSVVRFSEFSDIYIYSSDEGFVCHDTKGGTHVNEDALEMIHHVEAHLEAGLKVPRGVIPTLAWEALEQTARDAVEAWAPYGDPDPENPPEVSPNADIRFDSAMSDMKQALHYMTNDPAPEQPQAPRTKLQEILLDTEAKATLAERHPDEYKQIKGELDSE